MILAGVLLVPLAGFDAAVSGGYRWTDALQGYGAAVSAGVPLGLGIVPELKVTFDTLGYTDQVLGVDIRVFAQDVGFLLGVQVGPEFVPWLRPYAAGHLGVALGNSGTATGGHTRTTTWRARPSFDLVGGLAWVFEPGIRAGLELSYARVLDAEAVGHLGIGITTGTDW